MIELSPVTEESLKQLELDARDEEVQEVYASHGLDIKKAAEKASKNSTYSWAIYKEKKLLCLTGVVPHSTLSPIACPWLLTTKTLREDPRDLLRHTKKFIQDWLEEWDVLENHIDARYSESLRWAKWAGFDICEAQPFGYLQLPFHRIEIRRS